MLDITSILSDAIETCGFDAEEYAETKIEELTNDILQQYHIKSLLKDAIDAEVEKHDTDIVDHLEDAVHDFAIEVVDRAF